MKSVKIVLMKRPQTKKNKKNKMKTIKRRQEEDVLDILQDTIRNQSINFKTLSDASGLQKAYDDNENNVYVDGDTLYISGTKNADSLVSTAIDPSIQNIQKTTKRVNIKMYGMI